MIILVFNFMYGQKRNKMVKRQQLAERRLLAPASTSNCLEIVDKLVERVPRRDQRNHNKNGFLF